MNIKTVKVGYLLTNCYILEMDNKCLIIDPGSEPQMIIDNVKYEVVGVLITHNHPDHIGALNEILEKYSTKKYDKSNLNIGENIINIFDFIVINCPGHTDDSISYLFDNNLFSGDFIFEGTIGRTDLPSGNVLEMKKSIKNILKYPDDINIFPGHEECTTLKVERRNLEYFYGILR